ncbi:hypothetical protein GUITHDRAFT_65491 [Guillardia theta CCMP2712]|uniref:Endoplasmic reticulum-Golgi intermediate compartment protein 3 n=1 Tax=Guillardia theta (strain CCMP2712) TaxID=905079 RepID=L1JUD7_GUITC|nr:hypothetical protein GUITHDRAFT_65491 [Guillardia theta CCMP2712]EKX52186.1 hypothetical protein GUITHDRAFT_65491 [Guillardia theta CCMP2712]|eukprot:XP_005839166.1 hypothetical protein GUITHDRAFT_65491 [Guillardia theta CCMP2712]
MCRKFEEQGVDWVCQDGLSSFQQVVGFLSVGRPTLCWPRLREFDIYPKTIQDFQVRTLAGAVVSILGFLIMFVLILGEINLYLTIQTDHELSVDTSRGEKLQINFNITFHAMPCTIISLDTMDISGEQHIDVHHEVYKQRLDVDGNVILLLSRACLNVTNGSGDFTTLRAHAGFDAPLTGGECGSCYGAEESPDECCNTCDSVREAYRRRGWAFVNSDGIVQCKTEGFLLKMQEERHEGCRVVGTLQARLTREQVNKVAGNFHFSPGKSFSQQVGVHFQDLLVLRKTDYNVSHAINHLSFGRKYPGRVNPLDGVVRICEFRSAMYQYFVKVVPTQYQYRNGTILSTNQFSTTENTRQLEGFTRGLPGVFFFYDLSPIKATLAERNNSFLHFLTGLCAIIGGVFTVMGIIDSTIYTGTSSSRCFLL